MLTVSFKFSNSFFMIFLASSEMKGSFFCFNL
jgi:hypothetical protein